MTAARTAVFAALAPLAPFSRAAHRHSPVVLAYHDPDAETFEHHLSALVARYSIVPVESIVTALAGGALSELPPRPLSITIDDGHAGNLELLDVCAGHGVRPTIFACTRVDDGFWWAGLDPLTQRRLKSVPDAERRAEVAALRAAAGEAAPAGRAAGSALTADDLRALDAAGIDIQPHTRTHPVLTRCDDSTSRDEIAGSKRDLERLVGQPRTMFAYPNGDFSEREIAFATKAGIRWAFTTRPGFIRADSQPMKLPRVVVRDDAPVREVLARAGGLVGAMQAHTPARLWRVVRAG